MSLGKNSVFNPLNAAPEYTRGKRCLPVADPEYTRVQSVFFSVFFVFLSVKSLWSGNHGGSLVFADKSLFLF